MIMYPYFRIWENIAISFSNSIMFHIERLSHEKSFRGHSEPKFFFPPLNNNCDINYEVVMPLQPNIFFPCSLNGVL